MSTITEKGKKEGREGENMNADGKECTSLNCLVHFLKKTDLQRAFCVLSGKQNNSPLNGYYLFQVARYLECGSLQAGKWVLFTC